MLPTTQESPAVRTGQPTAIHQQQRRGLRAPGLLAQRPWLGLIMVLLGCGLFSVITVDLQAHGSLLQADMPLLSALHDIALHSSLFVRNAAILGSYLGQEGILAIGGLLALYFLVKRFWTELSMVLIGLFGEGAIWLFLSEYIKRPRPVFDVPVWHQMTNPTFPSGHSFGAVVCFGLLVYLISAKMPSRFWKWVVVIVALLITLYIGFSRIFVGDHYTTDILAGYALGIAWDGFAYTMVELTAVRNRQHKHVRHEQVRT